MTLVIVTFMVLGIAILLAKLVFPLFVNQAGQNLEIVGPQLDTVAQTSSQKDSFAGYKLGLPTGWNISYKLGSPTNSDWECLQTNSCQLLVITHDSADAQLKQVVLATPVGVKVNWPGQVKSVTQKFTLAGSDLQATVEDYLTVDPGTTENAGLVLQVYGCNNGFMCINAGPFSPTDSVNKAQMAELTDFMQQVKLQKV